MASLEAAFYDPDVVSEHSCYMFFSSLDPLYFRGKFVSEIITRVK